jgi:hypothetical protein
LKIPIRPISPKYEANSLIVYHHSEHLTDE